MTRHYSFFRCVVLGTIALPGLLAAGCSYPMHQLTTYELSYRPLNLPDKTVTIAIVSGFDIDRRCITDGFLLDGVAFPPLYGELKDLQFADDEMESGRVALVMHSLYWNSYPPQPQIENGLKWVVIPKTIHLNGGDIVEIEVIDGVGHVVRKKHDADRHNCKITAQSKSVFRLGLDLISILSGGPESGNSASLICPELKEEEWERVETGHHNEFIWVRPQD